MLNKGLNTLVFTSSSFSELSSKATNAIFIDFLRTLVIGNARGLIYCNECLLACGLSK